MSALLKTSSSSEFSVEGSLQSFFYDELLGYNQKSSHPLPKETLYYSSLIMDKFGESENYFEETEGKIREKALGVKLLECSRLSKEAQKRSLKDIGDTALFLCGFFSDSLKRKLVDHRYYRDIGQIAYVRLGTLVPDNLYGLDHFYQSLAKIFDQLATIISLVAKKMLDRDFGEKALFILSDPLK